MSQVIWITGLSGAGKTTLATELVNSLRFQGKHVIQLDGDELREVFDPFKDNLQSHNRKGRLALAMQYAQLCRVLAKQDLTVVIATISLFKEIHSWNRTHLPNYFEIYLDVPLDELRRRDPKAIYHRFDRGEIENVAGLDVEIDKPQNPDWLEVFDKHKPLSKLVNELLNELGKE
jgi:cytidine diphosphoramidate kinase